ncbi:MAG: aldo/keto reductase [Planctomycetes bacterium]|nr:aldo/keto reductase [Planctomycetota bacterium]
MAHRVRLGRTDLQVSPICFGTWQLSPRFWGPQPEDQLLGAMRRAFELGINFYDTADAYGDGLSEEVTGKALASLPRGQVVLATKVYWHFYGDGRRHPDLTKNYILSACEASLRRLKMDYIDLYQVHAWDPVSDPRETAEAMELLVKQGKVRHYGCSNWNCEQLRLGEKLGNYATLQPPYSLLKRGIENDVLPYCQANDVGTLVYSPLHRGLLSGKYKGGETFDDLRKGDPDFQGERFRLITARVAECGAIAGSYGLTTTQLMYAATLMHPGIDCAIAGIKNTAQIEEIAAAMGKRLSHEDCHKVRTLLSV